VTVWPEILAITTSLAVISLRMRDTNGRYEFRTIMPAGYGCPPDGPTQRLLDTLGRHGQRPAHVHFFVSAPGHRHLTTQINIAGDKYLYDDFAFATREGLIPKIVRQSDANKIREKGLNGPFAEIEFDFAMVPLSKSATDDAVHRRRVEAASPASTPQRVSYERPTPVPPPHTAPPAPPPRSAPLPLAASPAGSTHGAPRFSSVFGTRRR
jgi:hypothetical protein